MTSKLSFTGQMAVITGASSGIGRCITLELARRGMDLCLIGRDRDALQSLSKEFDPTRKCSIIQADFANEDQLASLRDQLENEIPSVDVLIHSAGAYSTAAFSEATAETFDWLYRVNVRAPFLLTQWLLPKLIKSQGQIVFINSSVVMQAKAGLAQYAATKQALKAVADSLRDEVNADGVRVLSIYPGRTATPMQARIFEQEGREYMPEKLTQPSDIADVVLNALLLPRSAEITDIHIRPMHK
ncbi:MAG: SDR family NAD(P)-dependent oxidoreductase [Chloroflexota bacterium]